MPTVIEEKPKIESPTVGTPDEENQEPTEEEIETSIRPGKVNAMDPDFILIFFFAGAADALDLVLDSIGLPSIVGKVIGIILDIGTFVIIGGWMYWRLKTTVVAGKLGESLKKIQDKSVLKRIQSQIAKKIRNRTIRRLAIRMVPALILECLPITGIFTSWSLAVISVLF